MQGGGELCQRVKNESPTPEGMRLGHLDGDGETDGDGLRLDTFASGRLQDPLSLTPTARGWWVLGSGFRPLEHSQKHC